MKEVAIEVDQLTVVVNWCLCFMVWNVHTLPLLNTRFKSRVKEGVTTPIDSDHGGFAEKRGSLTLNLELWLLFWLCHHFVDILIRQFFIFISCDLPHAFYTF